ncbi:MAG: phospholipid carrier-dependent glycosyltransferase [Blastocatellia bacterium]|nr:phospholipid carrier-dependent glycosyltransferase [Blastocatellia bacterium]
MALFLVAGIPRILAVFLLPNAFGDAFSYLEVINHMREKMADGTFGIKDLYGFWFPLYQVVCAALGYLFGYTYYLAKLVSALCGIGVCLLVYSLTMRLTDHRPLSLLAFGFAALSPLHIIYSSSSMTDIPHAFFVMATLSFALQNRWKTAAIFAVMAGLTRIESWLLIALLPALQFFFQRRISLAAGGLLLISPLLWFYISWKATGNPMSYFEVRNRYIADYAAANPRVATFTFNRLHLDAERLLISTNLGVLASCLVAAWLTAGRLLRQRFEAVSKEFAGVLATTIFFFYNLGFLLFAYFTGRQPDIWSRYGLLFFTLGLPVTAWTFLLIGRERLRLKTTIAAALLLIFLFQMKDQISEVAAVVSEETARTGIADFLKRVHRDDPSLSIYCEDGNVKFLTGISKEKFLTAYQLPSDATALLRRFDEAGVKYVVCNTWEVSQLTKLFPEVGKGKGNDIFHPVMRAGARYSRLEFWIYRYR